MKSKFSYIVRVKKQQLDTIQIKVSAAKFKLDAFELNLKSARQNLNKFCLPKSGNINELNENLKILSIMRDEVSTLSEKVELAKKELMHFTHQYKNANLEYEKMKFLEQDEIRVKLKAIKRKEELLLDEFATIKFAQNRDSL